MWTSKFKCIHNQWTPICVLLRNYGWSHPPKEIGTTVPNLTGREEEIAPLSPFGVPFDNRCDVPKQRVPCSWHRFTLCKCTVDQWEIDRFALFVFNSLSRSINSIHIQQNLCYLNTLSVPKYKYFLILTWSPRYCIAQQYL